MMQDRFDWPRASDVTSDSVRFSACLAPLALCNTDRWRQLLCHWRTSRNTPFKAGAWRVSFESAGNAQGSICAHFQVYGLATDLLA